MRLAAAALVGAVFGVVLCWSGMTDPDVIRAALTFQSAYLYLMFAAAVGCATLGMVVYRRARGELLLPRGERVERRHLAGAAIFGVGWGVSGACPGPIATQLGQGILYAVPLAVGALAGVYLYQRRERPETEPAADPAPETPERELIPA